MSTASSQRDTVEIGILYQFRRLAITPPKNRSCHVPNKRAFTQNLQKRPAFTPPKKHVSLLYHIVIKVRHIQYNGF